MVGLVILPVALCFKHRKKQRFEHTIVAYNFCIEMYILVESQISQKYGQIVPTPCGSILQASRPSHLPNKTKKTSSCKHTSINQSLCQGTVAGLPQAVGYFLTLYGRWEALDGCKILPQGVGTICPYF